MPYLKRDETFALSEVALATTSKVTLLQSWIDKDWTKLPTTSAGKTRKLSVTDAFMIGLALHLCRRSGIDCETANKIAFYATLAQNSFEKAVARYAAAGGPPTDEAYINYPVMHGYRLTLDDLHPAFRNLGNENEKYFLVMDLGPIMYGGVPKVEPKDIQICAAGEALTEALDHLIARRIVQIAPLSLILTSLNSELVRIKETL